MRSDLLGICIPTFNRDKGLNQALDKLVQTCSDSGIQIYISDNASCDDTQQVCKQYSSNYDFVHYYRHNSNIGPDDNFEFVLKWAQTKYRWLMADMTYVADMDVLLKDLSEDEFDLYIANANFFRADYLPNQVMLFDSSIDLMRTIGWHLTWISCMIYNSKLIDSMNFGRYRNSSFNQLAIVFETTANRKCKIKYNPRLLLDTIRMSKQSDWQDHIFVVFYKKLYNVLMSLPIYYPLEVKVACFQAHTRNCSLLSTHDHYVRYLHGQITKKEVEEHKFYILQAGYNNYRALLWMTSIPRGFWRVLSNLKLLCRGKIHDLNK